MTKRRQSNPPPDFISQPWRIIGANAGRKNLVEEGLGMGTRFFFFFIYYMYIKYISLSVTMIVTIIKRSLGVKNVKVIWD